MIQELIGTAILRRMDMRIDKTIDGGYFAVIDTENTWSNAVMPDNMLFNRPIKYNRKEGENHEISCY